MNGVDESTANKSRENSPTLLPVAAAAVRLTAPNLIHDQKQ